MKTMSRAEKKNYACKKQNEIKDMMNEMIEKITNAEAVADFLKSMFTYPDTIPAAKWSFLNRLHLFLRGSVDARGYKQWKDVGRYVKKNPTYLRILYPKQQKCMGYAKDENGCFIKNTETGEYEKEEQSYLAFRLVPVFDVHDTDGAELEYMKEAKALDCSKFPLVEIANHIGVSIDSDVSTGEYYACYSPQLKAITMCSDREQTFLHELAHALDHKINVAEYRNSTDTKEMREIVAEFTACFLAHIYGKKAELSATKAYLEYNKGKNKTLAAAIENAFSRCYNIINFVMAFKEKEVAA